MNSTHGVLGGLEGLTIAGLLLKVGLKACLALAAVCGQGPLAVTFAQVSGGSPDHLGVAHASTCTKNNWFSN